MANQMVNTTVSNGLQILIAGVRKTIINLSNKDGTN